MYFEPYWDSIANFGTLKDAIKEAYNTGYDQGVEDGKDVAYNNGYSDGKEDSTKHTEELQSLKDQRDEAIKKLQEVFAALNTNK